MVRFSVIISCHDRKEFVLDAIRSVMGQHYERDEIEIILVKNFNDPEIDSFCSVNGITTFMENGGTLGDKMAIGLENSNGDIVCFLDDDDVFYPHKLQSVDSVFSEHGDTVFFHDRPSVSDSYAEIDVPADSGMILKSLTVSSGSDTKESSVMHMFLERVHWYASCISVQREFAVENIGLLKKARASYDKLWFFSSVNSGKKLASTAESLTGYRLHGSLTTVISDIETFLERKEKFYRRSLKSIELMRNEFKANRNVKAALELEFTHERAMVSFFSSKKEDRIPFRMLFNFTVMSIRYRIFRNLVWSGLSLSSRIVPAQARLLFYMLTQKSYNL